MSDHPEQNREEPAGTNKEKFLQGLDKAAGPDETGKTPAKFPDNMVMATFTYNEPCGCVATVRIHESGTVVNVPGIVYCRKHAAADALREACKQVSEVLTLEMNDTDGVHYWDKGDVETLDAALALAEPAVQADEETPDAHIS